MDGITPKIGSKHWCRKMLNDKVAKDSGSVKLFSITALGKCCCDEYYCTDCNICRKRGMYSSELRSNEVSEKQLKSENNFKGIKFLTKQDELDFMNKLRGERLERKLRRVCF